MLSIFSAALLLLLILSTFMQDHSSRCVSAGSSKDKNREGHRHTADDTHRREKEAKLIMAQMKKDHTKYKPDTYPYGCKSFGFTVPNAMQKIELDDLGHYVIHVFTFPTLPRTFVAVPSKSGNRNWSALFYQLMYGKVPTNHELTMEPFYSDCRHNRNVPFDEDADTVWLLVRNPYVRLLSIYLKKVQANRSDNTYTKKMRKQDVTFESFLATLENDILHGLPASKKYTISPFERAMRLCKLDHHLCFQAAYLSAKQDNKKNPVRVLYLEQQAQWYPKFLKCFGIQKEQVVGEDWKHYAKRPCFYTPTGNCEDALTSQPVKSRSATPSPSVSTHAHNSSAMQHGATGITGGAGALLHTPHNTTRRLDPVWFRDHPPSLSPALLKASTSGVEPTPTVTPATTAEKKSKRPKKTSSSKLAQSAAPDPLHGADTMTQMRLHYNIRNALRVSYLYAYDLNNLGYPIWDGVSELPHPPLNF